MAGAAVRRHRRAALAIWAAEFDTLAAAAGSAYAQVRADYSAPPSADSAEALRSACERLLPARAAARLLARGPAPRRPRRGRARGKPLAPEASTGEVARTVALVKLAEWSAVAKAAGQPPLFAADDFDAGLSEGWVEEFFDALPGEAAVLLTTAAPTARWARRAAAVLEMRQGSVGAPRALYAVQA